MDLLAKWICADIQKMADESPDHERCGLIVQGDVVELDNIHEDPRSFFKMSESDIKVYLNEDFVIWHTHTRQGYRQLSKEDVILAKMWQHPILMAQSGTGYQDFYDPLRLSPYDGRTWRTYHSNCYTLVQDFYENELSIFLPDFYLDYPNQFDSCNFSKFELFLPKNGFRKLERTELLQVGDIVITTENLNAPAWHCSVIVRTDPMQFCLSQWVDRPSRYFGYRAIANKVSSIWRHKDVN